MILVVGATGLLGSETCRRLRAQGRDVRGLVRKGSPAECMLREIGVEIATGDLRDPAAVDAALRGVDCIVSTATAMGSKDKSLSLRAIDRDAQLRLVGLAKAAGVARFVYVSASPNLRSSAPLIGYKRQVEDAVRASGMRWTILQPTCFMEVWLSATLGWNFDEARATIFGAGTTPLSWISILDVANHVVQAIDDPRLANRDLPLGGPEALSPNEVVQVFERVTGRPYRAKHVPRAVLLMSPLVALFNEGAASGMSMGAQTALGDAIDSPLQRELGLPLTTVEQYAWRAAARRSSLQVKEKVDNLQA